MQQTLKELTSWIKSDPKLSILLREAQSHDGGDAAHDSSHLLRVALWTIRIGGSEVARDEAVAAALLHDLVNLPKDHPERAKASEYSAERSLPLLQNLGFSAAAIERITGAIRDHSFSRGAVPTTPLGSALQDADRLEALGAIGIMRWFATGVKLGSNFFHAEDPWGEARALDDKKFSLDHAFTKLLKLPATFRTEKGREEARRRAQTLEDFLNRTAEELGVPRP